MVRRGFRAAAVLAALCVVACGSDETTPGGDTETRALMGEIYRAIQVLLPASAEPEPFEDPAKAAEFEAALARLSTSTDRLVDHVEGDAQGGFLARSIAYDTARVAQAYEAGRRDRAAFLVRRITESCIVCHSRLPDTADRPLAKGFLDVEGLAALPPDQRAALQLATRRFDDALATIEAQLASPDHPAMLLGALTDLLVVSVRIQQDFDRPVPVLERFARRPDLWSALRRDVEAWIAALPELRARTAGPPRLAVARALVEEARGLATVPDSHRSVAHYVAASSVLERFVEADPGPSAETAEAYYLLGLTEAWIGRNYWVTSAPFLLETSIRMAPGEPLARDAFALLERELLASFEGAEESLPPGDAEELAELRALIDARP